MAPAPSSPRPLRYTDLPRMSRQVPQTELLHTIYFKRITYPFSDRLAELWIVEVDTEGHEQWRTVESFLQNMGHPRDDLTLRQSANQWRRFYDIPERDHSTSPHQQYPILPHPCHSNFSTNQPASWIPDHSHILRHCWGRSANYHSQGDPTSSLPRSTSSPRPLATPLMSLPLTPSRLLIRQPPSTPLTSSSSSAMDTKPSQPSL